MMYKLEKYIIFKLKILKLNIILLVIYLAKFMEIKMNFCFSEIIIPIINIYNKLKK